MPRKKKDIVDDVMKMINEEIDDCNSHQDISDLADKVMGKLLDNADKNGETNMNKKWNDFMHKPIITVTYSRKGTKIEGGQCFGFEMFEGAKNMINAILQMIPSEHRLEVIGDVLSNLDMDDENSVKPEED